jgi:hypothetical protein
MNGIYINENLDTEPLARDRVYEFAWSFDSLPLKRATDPARTGRLGG